MKLEREFNKRARANDNKDDFFNRSCEHAQNLLIEWSQNREGDLSRMVVDQKTLEQTFGSIIAVASYLKLTHDSTSRLTYRQELQNTVDVACNIVDRSIDKIVPDYIEQPKTWEI